MFGASSFGFGNDTGAGVDSFSSLPSEPGNGGVANGSDGPVGVVTMS